MYLTFGTAQLMADLLAPHIDSLTDEENAALHRLLADLDAAHNISEMPVGVRHNESDETRIVFAVSLGLDLIGRVDHVRKRGAFVAAWNLRDRLVVTGFERQGDHD
jgi:hypothetical protein